MDEDGSDIMNNMFDKHHGILFSKIAIISVCIYIILGLIFAFTGILENDLLIWIVRSIIIIALISSIIAILLLRTISDKNINKINEAKLFAYVSLLVSLGIIVLASITAIFELPV